MTIETRELTDKLSSGEITSIKLNATGSDNDVLMRSEVDTAIDTKILAKGALVWKGKWVAGEYLAKDMVNADGWLMVATATTSERAGPLPIGDSYWIAANLSLVPATTSAKQIIFGVRYTQTDYDAFLSGYRVYTVAGKHYKLFSIKSGMATPEYQLGFMAGVTGWTDIPITPTVLEIGQTLDLFALVDVEAAVPDTFEGDWAYTTTATPTNPAVGVIGHSLSVPNKIRVNWTDADSGDREAELDLISEGDIITAGPIALLVQAITKDVGNGYFEFTILPASRLSIDATYTFTFEYKVASLLPYDIHTDYWLTNDNGQGLFIVDGVYDDITADDNCYGMDIRVQGVNYSSDWEIMSPASNLGGGSPFPQSQYRAVKATGITITDDTYEAIVSTELTNPAAGWYEYKIAIQWISNTIVNSLLLRYSIDDGSTWTVFSLESKNVTDTPAFNFTFPNEEDGTSTLFLHVEAAKENTADVITITSASAIIDQKS